MTPEDYAQNIINMPKIDLVRRYVTAAKQHLPSEDTLQLLHRNVQRFRGGLVFKAHRLCVSLNSRLASNKEEEDTLQLALPFGGEAFQVQGTTSRFTRPQSSRIDFGAARSRGGGLTTCRARAVPCRRKATPGVFVAGDAACPPGACGSACPPEPVSRQFVNLSAQTDQARGGNDQVGL